MHAPESASALSRWYTRMVGGCHLHPCLSRQWMQVARKPSDSRPSMAPSSSRKCSRQVAGKKYGNLRIWHLRVHLVALQKNEAVTLPLSDLAHMAELYCHPPWPKQLAPGMEVMRPGVATKC